MNFCAMNLRIETLRGFACLLLVTYHVIGADPSLGLKVQDGALRWFNDGLAYLRMPLFTFLSGFVYGKRPFSGSSRLFILGKVRRLLIPMFVVGTGFWLLQSLTPGVNSSGGSWYLMHLKPVAHFWFVESLFWIFLVIWALERLSLIKNTLGFSITVGLACAVYLTIPGWPWLGIEGAIYLMPYFLMGLACTRFSLAPWLAREWVKVGLVLLSVGLFFYMGRPIPNPDRRTAAMLLIGLSLCLSCLIWARGVRCLAWVGRYSYAIYLFHVFFTASIRIALHQVGISYFFLDMVLGIAMGLLGPMLIEHGAGRYKWSALLLLGRRAQETN
jgi:fucose 4-O-acetylase-like acetyltransferase